LTIWSNNLSKFIAKGKNQTRIAFFISRGMLTGSSLTRLTVESLFLHAAIFRSVCLFYALISSIPKLFAVRFALHRTL
jgi:hypothetical protein